jgi:hypothetical protein
LLRATVKVLRTNSQEYGFFLQDDWRVNPVFTLNLGVRYDYQRIAKPPITNPNPALLANGFDTGFRPNDTNNLAPRIGASYAFDEKTVIRGGYGLYYGRTPAILTGTAHSQNGIQVVAFDVNCVTNPTSCPRYPNIFSSLSSVPAGATRPPLNLYLFSQDYKQPFTHQARLQFEREIFPNYTFGVSYSIFRGDDLTRTRNANLLAPAQVTVPIFSGATNTGQTATIERFSTARLVSGFDRISLFESTANSFYQGLTFEPPFC